jgi:hypothetical protein
MHQPRISAATTSVGFLRDDFTDANGTILHFHTPDGGGDPFTWVQGPDWGPPEAIIQDNAVIAREGFDWAYTTSQPTGDWAEVDIEVFGDNSAASSGGQDIVLWMRTDHVGLHDGYEVYRSIGSFANSVSVSVPGQQYVYHFPTVKVEPGIETFRAEINSRGEMEVSVNGQLVLTAPLGTLQPPAKTGLGFWTSMNPTVRLTSFRAGTRGPAQRQLVVTCDPASQVRGQDVTCTARLNTAEAWSAVQMTSTSDDGDRALADLHPTEDGKGFFTKGPAVFSSTVEVIGDFFGESDIPEPLRGSGSFAVTTRPDFASPVLPPGDPPPLFDQLKDSGRPPQRLGGFTRPTFDFGSSNAANLASLQVTTGANRGHSYLTSSPPLRRPFVLLHIALTGKGAWYQDQDGMDHGHTTGPNGRPYCVHQQITGPLLEQVLDHEGGLNESHYTIWRDIALPDERTRSFVESFHFPSAIGQKSAIDRLGVAWDSYTEEAYAHFHGPFEARTVGSDFSVTQARLGCDFDNNAGD